MIDEPSGILAEYLTSHYVSLKRRLTRALGSSDLAGDALQDTWLRLQSMPQDGLITSPAGYLLRVALNIGVDILRRQSRTLSLDEVEELQTLADPAPGPAQLFEARSEMTAMLERVGRMPERRREIFLMVHWEGMAHKEVAQHLGISLRTITSELKTAHDALSIALDHEKK